jgi:hypothetical protein
MTENVPITNSVSVTVTWTPSLSFPVSPMTVTVFSSKGEFKAAGTVLATVPKELSRTVTILKTGTTSFTEVVRVPVEVIVQANKLGVGSLRYERTFDDSTLVLAGTAAIDLGITGRLGADFNVSRLALHFEDESLQQIVKLGAAPTVQADISFTGSGLLRAVWELATPESTSGTAVFLPIQTVRRFLSIQGRATLTSPALPADAVGSYRVRLRIEDPPATFDTPEVQYYVGDDSATNLVPTFDRLWNHVPST